MSRNWRKGEATQANRCIIEIHGRIVVHRGEGPKNAGVRWKEKSSAEETEEPTSEGSGGTSKQSMTK